MKDSRTPCPPTASMQAASSLVGTAYASPSAWKRECHRRCPPYKTPAGTNGRTLTLLRRTGPGVGRDRNARAGGIDPTDADPFRGRARGERIGTQAIVADLVEVIAQRQDSHGSIDEPARPIPIGRAVGLADDLMRRNGSPARLSDRVAAVIRPGRAGAEHGSGNDDSKEISSHAGPVADVAPLR